MPDLTSARLTVTCSSLAELRLTVKFSVTAEPAPPSVTDGESIDMDGGSSSVIVPVPVPAVVDTVAFVGLLSATRMVSCGSSTVSPVTDTSNVADPLSVPAAKVKCRR